MSATRESRSRPDVGIVTVETVGYNQQGTTVITFRRTVMVYKRGRGPVTPGPVVDGRSAGDA